MSVRDWVDQRIKVESRQVGILCLDVDHHRVVVPGEVDVERHAVVEVGEGNTVLSTYRLPDDNLVDVVELIPIFISEK